MERTEELRASIDTRKANYQSALLDAIDDEDVTEIKAVVSKILADFADISFINALHSAVRKNSPKIIEILVECGFRVDDKDFYGDTPLHTACEARFEDCVETLLKCGSNSKIKNSKGYFPLEQTVEYLKYRIVNVQFCNQEQHRRLQCEFNEIFNIVKLFLKYKGSFNDKNIDDRKIVRTMVIEGFPRIAHFFAENGFDLSVVDDGGFTLLHDAARDGNWEAIAELVQYIDPNCISRCSKTPLHEAASKGSPKCVDILLIHGANIDALDGHKQTPLCKALLCTSSCSIQVVERFLHSRPSMDHVIRSISDSSKEFREMFEGDPRKQEALITHILKMKAAGIHVGDAKFILDFLNVANDGQSSFLTSYIKEVTGMMEMRLVSHFSVYDFMTRNPVDVAWYLNPQLSVFFEARSYAFKFPLYAEYLEAVYHRASKRREVLEKGGPTLFNILAIRGMPEPCIKNVLAYLKDLDLDYVINFVKRRKGK